MIKSSANNLSQKVISGSKLRLLFYCPAVGSHGYAGSQRTLEFAESLGRNGAIVYLASPYLKQPRSIGENLFLSPLPITPFGIMAGLTNLAVKKRIDVILERLEGGNIIASGYGPIIGKLLNIPVACEIHVPPTDLPTRISSFLWLRCSLKYSSKTFVISQNVAKMLYLHQKSFNKKTVVIPNGYDASKIKTAAGPMKEIRQSLSLKKKIICYFGELSEEKGIDLIIRLIENDKNSRFYFVVGGWGPFEGILKKMAEEKPDSIKYLGKVSKEKIFNYLRVCDLSLALYRKTQLGGRFFGQPLKVYESLAAGTNAMITSRMNLPDEIFKLCTLVEPRIEDIEGKMDEACLRKYDETWQNCLRVTMPSYSWDSIAARIFIPELRSLVVKK